MKLEIKTGLVKMPLRIIIHGEEGIGKSTWAAGANKPLFLNVDDGLINIDVPRFDIKHANWQSLLNVIALLLREQHEYQTLIIDTLDKVEQSIIWPQVCEEKGKDNIEDIGFARGYGMALGLWNRLLNGLDMLRDERKMNVILIAHTQITKIEDPTLMPYDRWCLKLHKKASHLVQEWADCVFYAARRTLLKSAGNYFDVEKKQAIGTGERILYASDNPAYEAKSRIPLPVEMPLEFAAFEQHLIDPVAAQAQSVATESQSEIN